MRIGVDAMGGDYAPDSIVEGALEALAHFGPDDKLVLIGDESRITELLRSAGSDLEQIETVNATEVITMSDHPAKAFTQKRDSSIAVGFGLLKNGLIDGFTSAGNTGAMLVGASYTVNVIPGVFRPALATLLPSINGRSSVILDIGINPDCKPDVLLQYGILGSLYAKHVLGIDSPRVGLMNIGEEESKGSAAVKAAYELLKEHPGINFIGNTEGHDLFGPTMPDVIVCDGFVGNVIIKQAEAFFEIYKSRNLKDEFFESLNFEHIGGTPVVGINANVVIGHGKSKSTAIKNMVLETCKVVEADLANKIRETI